MLHDLFQGDGDSSLENPALLDRLVTEKLQAETVAVEGWKWIEVALDLPHGYSHGLQSLSCDPAPMTDEEEAVHTKRLSEYQALEEEHAGQDDPPPRDRYSAWRVGSRDPKDRDPAFSLQSDRHRAGRGLRHV